MSTPPRDYSTHYGTTATASGIAGEPPDSSAQTRATAEREDWRDPVQRTDEIELLISAAVFFGLLQVPGRLITFWAEWSSHQPLAIFKVGLALMQVGYGVVFVLLAAFLFHLILRGLWIGLIGLRSVFPRGIDWERLSKAAPITSEYQRIHMPELSTTIVSIDRLASIVFICASLLVMMILPGVVFALLGLFLGSQQLAWVTLAILIALMLPLLMQLVLDYGLAAHSPRWAAKPWLRRTVTRITAITSRFLPRGLVMAPMLTLQSRVSPLWFTLGLSVAMGVVMSAFPLHLLGQQMSNKSGAYVQIDDAIERYGMTQSASADDTAGRSADPRLDRVQVNGAWVELFVPMRPRRDQGVLRARCPAYARAVPETGLDSAAASSMRDCMAGLWRITLDGAPLPPAAFELARKGNQRGLLAMLPTAPLAPGRHQIVATRLPTAVEGERSGQPTPPHSLLFWVAR